VIKSSKGELEASRERDRKLERRVPLKHKVKRVNKKKGFIFEENLGFEMCGPKLRGYKDQGDIVRETIYTI